MDSSTLYLVTLLVLIMTPLTMEERDKMCVFQDLDSAEDSREAVQIGNNSKACGPALPPSNRLESHKWKAHRGWYQNGQSWVPSKEGCGGIIEATENYQYGILTSPNWPHALPSQAKCEWLLYDFQSLFYVVNGRFSNSESEEAGVLTVKIDGHSQGTQTIFLGGDFLHQKYLLNVNRRKISVTLTTNLFHDYNETRKGARLTWWTVPAPNPEFVRIFRSQLPEERLQYPDIFPATLQKGKSTGYLFFYKDVEWTYEAIIYLAVLHNQTGISCSMHKVSMYTIRYDQKVRLLATRQCVVHHGQLTLSILGDEQLESTPLGIEINIREGISLVNLSIIVFPKYISSVDRLFNDEGCYTSMSKNDDDVAFFHTEHFNDTNNPSVKYNNELRCDPTSYVSAPILDSFIQVQTQTDIQLSPSCTADFLKVGGQRVCGFNGPDTYISSPVDNSLIERTVTYYTNILHSTTPVLASEPESENTSAILALNPFLSGCYISNPNVSSPFWEVDLVDVFHVKGVRIDTISARLDNVTVAVYVRNGDRQWPVLTYQTCWHGRMSAYQELLNCAELVSGRYLAIVKGSENLPLCIVEVFVNIAAPLAAWRNAAYRKKAYDSNGTGTSYDSLVDGDPITCILHELPAKMFYIFNLGHSKIVHAVRLYLHTTALTVGFRVFLGAHDNISCAVFDEPNEEDLGILTSCARPTLTDTVNLGDLVNVTNLCEVIIYADFNDKTSTNAALYKEAFLSLESSSELPRVPAIVDGNPMSCEYTDYAFFVDLHEFHIVEGVILNFGDDQQNTDEVEVWVSPFTSVVKHTLKYSYLCHGKTFIDSYKLKLLCSLPIVGKHVILEISGEDDSVLHLCEVQVIAVPYDKEKGLQNVALFKHARQGPMTTQLSAEDSPQLFYHGHGARLAVDGDKSMINTNITCTTVLGEGDTKAWWEVDLANMYRVTAVGVLLCSPVNNSYELSIYVNDGLPNHHRLCHRGPPGNFMSCGQIIWGLFVRLVSSENMCLCEVEVMAKPLITYERFGERVRPMHSLNNKNYFELLNFETDMSIEKRGFSALYKADNLKHFSSLADCGKLVREHDATIDSPNYPNSYALANDSYICHWMVYTPYDSFTTVYIEYLNLTQPASPNKCFHDVLIISNSAGQQITKCGYITKEMVYMKTYKNEYLHVTLMVRKFKTQENKIVPGRGGMRLKFMSYDECPHEEYAAAECDEEDTPFDYEHISENVWCRSILIASFTGYMQLTFSRWNTEYVSQEDCDLELLTERRHGLDRFCVNLTHSSVNITMQTGDKVMIVSITGRWFHEKHCLRPYAHDYVLGFNGTDIKSFGYPACYDPENISLTWTFSTHLIGTVRITFNDVKLLPDDYDGLNSGAFEVKNSIKYEFHEDVINRTDCIDRPIDLLYPVFPNSVLKIFFMPTKGSHNATRFWFTYSFEDYSKEEVQRVLVANVHKPYRSDIAIFDVVHLQENIFIVGHQKVFIPVDGLYLISLGIIPRSVSLKSNSSLRVKVNEKLTILKTYGTFGQKASATAVFNMSSGDMLMIFTDYTMPDTFNNSTFTIVFASPIKDGNAFTSYLAKDKYDMGLVLPFEYISTDVGNPAVKDPKVFMPSREGVYWVSLRPMQHRSAEVIRLTLRVNSTTYLESYGYGSVPGSASAALFLRLGDTVTVTVSEGVAGGYTLFSIAHLYYNQKRFVGSQSNIAYTGLVDKCTNQSPLLFGHALLALGVNITNSSMFTVPRKGLYIISIRIDVPRTLLLPGDQVLDVRVNGRTEVSGYARSNPTERVSVLRLNANDTLTVVAGDCNTLGNQTLFSFAYVDK